MGEQQTEKRSVKPPKGMTCVLVGMRNSGEEGSQSGYFCMKYLIRPQVTEELLFENHEITDGEFGVAGILLYGKECTIVDDVQKPPQVFLLCGVKAAVVSDEFMAVLRSRANQYK